MLGAEFGLGVVLGRPFVSRRTFSVETDDIATEVTGAGYSLQEIVDGFVAREIEHLEISE